MSFAIQLSSQLQVRTIISTSPTYLQLHSMHDAKKMCLVYIISECKKDILILWDNSASVGINNFKDKVLPFLKKLVTNAKLNVGKEGTHLGFTTFSTEDKTKALLKVGEKTEADELESWLDTLDYKNDLMGDQTYTGKAFKLASTDVSQPKPCCLARLHFSNCLCQCR